MDKQTSQRVIRVFISSTFRDMQAERDRLVKFIFPQLRKLCERRGVTWGEVDLRWGITNEEKADGQVLSICLEEIKRCRPYFIGLLGERYGWIPNDIQQEIFDGEPWISENRGHSVTELEILHGVLNNPDMANHALFYFRDPAYIQQLPSEQQRDFIEIPWKEDIEQFGLEQAQKHVEGRNAKLAELKERIRNTSELQLKENFRDSKQLGEWVLDDMTAVIDRLFPEGSQLDPLERETAEHEVFAASRANVYIGGQAYFKQLNTHCQSDELPLVILGESGSGKSALLANWALKYRAEHPEVLVLMHFIGGTAASSDWTAMLRRIMSELKRHFNIQEDIPTQPDAVRADFGSWLHKAAAKGNTLIILDALNQLDEGGGAQELSWLPPEIPKNITLIMSTLPGKSLEELRRRNWPTLEVQLLNPGERQELIREYLALYSKSLSTERVQRIVDDPQSGNPLYLRILLDELRQFGSHERLDERIDSYLDADSIPALFELILERCERDFQGEQPYLVKESMSLLWVARRGLSEVELLELLGSGGLPMPHGLWAPFYLALEQSFLNRSGLIGFFHDHICQAIQDRYLKKLSDQKLAHLRLAEYFEKQDEATVRKVDELPWHLAKASEWQRLYRLLADLDFFSAAWKANNYDVMTYWSQVEAHSKLKCESAYQQVIEHPEELEENTWLGIAVLLQKFGRLEPAMTIYQKQEQAYRQSHNLEGLSASLGNQAIILQEWGKLEEAMMLFKEKKSICHQLGDLDGLSNSLGNQATIFQKQGKPGKAMALFKEVERTFRQLGNLDGLQRSLTSQANILSGWGYLKEAMALHKEGERICRQLGNMVGLSNSLNNQAVILKDQGKLEEAMALLKDVERIYRQVGNLYGLQASFVNQALILQKRGKPEEAMALYKEQETISRKLKNPHGTAISLTNQAVLLYKKGEKKEALQLVREGLALARKHGYQALIPQIETLIKKMSKK